MKMENTIAATCGVALCLAASAAVFAADTGTSTTMKPLMAASLDAGTRHVVSFYLQKDSQCQLTLMIEDKALEEANAGATQAARLQLLIQPGRSVYVDSADGKSIRYVCNSGAAAMTATKLDRVADATENE